MILSPPRTLLDHIPFEAVSCMTADRLTFGISIAVAVGRAALEEMGAVAEGRVRAEDWEAAMEGGGLAAGVCVRACWW